MKIKNFVDSLECDFFTGVPSSSLLKSLSNYLELKFGSSPRHHIIAANEGNAVALAVGYHLATQKCPVVYMQNSCEGNAVNPITSLMDEHAYSIPAIYVIGWMDEPGIYDVQQYVYQDNVSRKLLDIMNIPYYIVENTTTEEDLLKKIKEFKKILGNDRSVAFVIKEGALISDIDVVDNDNDISMRESIVNTITDFTGEDIVISSTDEISFELFELREKKRQDHKCDFLTNCSMGHASSIALSLSIIRPQERIWCIDGYDTLIMQMGALTRIGNYEPNNLVHIAINNHSITQSSAQKFKILDIAKACGYKKIYQVTTLNELKNVLREVVLNKTLTFIEIKDYSDSTGNFVKPMITLKENKYGFMKNLHKPSLVLRRKEMSYLLSIKQYDKVLTCFSEIFKNFNYRLISSYFYIAISAFKELYPQDDVNQFFNKHYTEEMDLGEKITELLTSDYFMNNIDKSSILFENLLEILFKEKDIKLLYRNSFISLINGLTTKKEIKIDIPSNNNYILLSGIGWSGSGAVVDYLKEFDNVIFSGYEWSIFEDEQCGFKNLIKNKDNHDTLWKQAIKFYFGLLGCQKLSSNWWVHKALFGAYNRAHSEHGKKKYAELMGIMGKSLGNLILGALSRNKELCNSSLHSVGKILLSLCSADFDDNSTIIIDNAVHINNASILQYLDNAKMIAVIRDPRSNYVSLKRECVAYSQDTDEQAKTFVCRYKSKLKKISSEIKLLTQHGGADRIKLVHFEDFVLNEDFRDSVVNFLFLNLKDWTSPQKYFKPNESSKNVYNFKDYENQDEIKLIAKLAEEYLYKFNE